MKILFVSVFGYHFFNWVLQLKDSGHEVFWLDVNDANTYVKRIDFVHQIVKWKNRYDYPGRQRIKKNFPVLNSIIQKYNERDFIDVFQKTIREIQPDVVHSFEMFSACVPVLKIMKQYPEIKWIYTTWGTDLFYYQNDQEKLKGIKAVFERLDYMFADCDRDRQLAKKLGFKGSYLGTFPGGGGYDLEWCKTKLTEFQNRKIILIKGYQNKFGRCISVLRALKEIENELQEYDIVVFGANEEVSDFVEQAGLYEMNNIKVFGLVGRGEVLGLMGKSIIYIGNSISDGMPNTLLEAIIMEAFPIQSNPGGATAEIVEHGKNGFLIENAEDPEEIAAAILKTIQNPELLRSAIEYNSQFIKPKLDRDYLQKRVLEIYESIECIQ